MAGGAWREKGFQIDPPKPTRGLQGVVEVAQYPWTQFINGFVVGAICATGALWLLIPYLPFAR